MALGQKRGTHGMRMETCAGIAPIMCPSGGEFSEPAKMGRNSFLPALGLPNDILLEGGVLNRAARPMAGGRTCQGAGGETALHEIAAGRSFPIDHLPGDENARDLL